MSLCKGRIVGAESTDAVRRYRQASCGALPPDLAKHQDRPVVAVNMNKTIVRTSGKTRA
jgi:hypothetical protein